MNPDYANGLFELVGAVFCWANVRRLYIDRSIRGVYWPATAFFAAWGVWNLYYYSALDQPASFAAGVVMASGNLAWTALAVRLLYAQRANRRT